MAASIPKTMWITDVTNLRTLNLPTVSYILIPIAIIEVSRMQRSDWSGLEGVLWRIRKHKYAARPHNSCYEIGEEMAPIS